MGGRVAEKITFGDISTGASQDIAHSSEIARSMVTKYGMSDVLGPVLYGKDTDEVFLGMDYSHSKNYSETYATQIDNEIKRILTECFDKCENILTEHNDKLVLIAETLVEKEKISGETFLKLMDENYNPDDEKEEVVEEITESPVVETEAENNKESEESSVSVEETTDTLVDSENEE